MKKTKTAVLSIAVPLILCALAGCRQSTIDNDPKTINVQITDGGYGTKWMTALKNKFEALYAKENYKVNIMRPHKSNAAEDDLNALKAGENIADVFFSSDLLVQRCVSDPDYPNLVADITDTVYNKAPISFDGKEENTTVAEKINEATGYFPYQYMVGDRSYCFMYRKAVGGFVVNKLKLDLIGSAIKENLPIPVTTNQLIHEIEVIHKYGVDHKTSATTPIEPMTFIGGSMKNGYPNCFIYTLVTQEGGIDYWNSIWSLEKSDGTPMNKADADKIFIDKKEPIVNTLETMHHVFDSKVFFQGSANADLASAHLMIANNFNNCYGAVFMNDGDWMYNETLTAEVAGEDDVKNLRFINYPVSSKIGTKLWGDKTSAEQCEAALIAIINKVDEGKLADQIYNDLKSTYTFIDADSVLTVCKARGVFVSRGGEIGTAYISNRSDKKDIAALLLRMFASQDFANLYHEKTHGYTPYSVITSETVEKDTYFEGLDKIFLNPYREGIWSTPTNTRFTYKSYPRDLFPELGLTACHKIYTSNTNNYNDDGTVKDTTYASYASGAQAMYEKEKLNYEEKFNLWIAS